jgi:branched-chain amino acid transport system substrate-binding protein
MVTSTASPAADVTFDLKYGVLAGLTGDPAPDGQAWNEAARLAIEQIQKSLDRLKISGIKAELSDSQDSQGSPQPGVEGAQKLVNVDHVQVIVGDFYSSVTSAVATSVTIPNNVLIFTGGQNTVTAPSAAVALGPSRHTKQAGRAHNCAGARRQG